MRWRINNKAQSSAEFMIMFGAVLFFFIIFVSIINMNILERQEAKKKILLQSIALSVRDEISFAAESSDGYTREFEIPTTILGASYVIYLQDDRVFYGMDSLLSSYAIFNVTGNVQKGVNLIQKENGTVYLNV